VSVLIFSRPSTTPNQYVAGQGVADAHLGHHALALKRAQAGQPGHAGQLRRIERAAALVHGRGGFGHTGKT
jgi:hypothetical protein